MPLSGRMKVLLSALVIGLAGVSGLPAESQQADMRLQGTVEKLDAKLLVLRGNDGTATSVSLDSGTAVFTNQPSSLSAVKPGDYVASAAVKGADGKLHSKEL